MPTALADESLIPALHWLTAKDWAYSHGCIVYDCNYVLLLDNLDRWFSGRELRNLVDLKRGY